MPPSLSQSLVQQMRMEQRLTPQLIQSMTILQKPVAELEAFINASLETNAALEIDEPDGTEEDGAAGQKPPPAEDRRGADRESYSHLANLARAYDLDGDEWRPYSPRRAAPTDDEDPKMGALTNTAGRPVGLNEHLLNEWGVTEIGDEVRRAGEAIISQLDPDGYLRVPLPEISTSVKPPIPVEVLNEALREVQKLEPLGVGARDVVECLLLQLDALPGDNTIERTLIKNHLNDIIHNRLPAVAQATGYSLGEIKEALRAMRSQLCLHPGTLVENRAAPIVRPDVIVEYAETGGGLTVRLARGNLPRLRINENVATLARSKHNGREREFAKRQVDAATAIIDAVRFRQARLLEVAHGIVERQKDFFDLGPEGLRVCRMGDLAAQFGCDPSTISRAVADKYMQTPRGIYPMRYFFTGGMETEDGQTVGWDRVKNRVKELIEKENPRNPISDDQIAELLKKEGISVSRRTVAKYRQQLDIPSVRQRREY